MNRSILFLMLVTFAIPSAVSIFDFGIKDITLVIVEFVAQLATIGILISVMLKGKEKARSKQYMLNILLLSAVVFSFVADILYNLRIVGFVHFSQKDILYLFDQICFTGFAASIFSIVILMLSPFLLKEKFWLLISAPILLIDLVISYKYILVPYYAKDYSIALKINTSVYAIILCFLSAVLVPFSIRIMQRKSFWFFQIIFLFIIADFAIRYQAIVVNNTVFSWAEFGWASTFIALFWLTWLSRHSLEFVESNIILSPYLSVRSIGTIAVTGANSLFLLGVMLFNFYSIRQAADITNILFLMYIFWLIANEASFRLSNDLQIILPKMFHSTKHVSDSGLISYNLNKVEIGNQISEIKEILDSYNGLVDQANKVIELSSLVSRSGAIINITAQVSHDIRSPLAALNMATDSLKELSEDKRLLIRNATQRINDIANQLLQKGRSELGKNSISESAGVVESVLIVSALEMIISEKRSEFRERLNLKIEGEFNGGYGLFVKIDPVEFSRVISNLVNNSVEAISESGRVIVAISSRGQDVMISIVDNGKGMPQDIVALLGVSGASFGKEGSDSGRGLGLSHARNTIQNAGGSLKIQSNEGLGTEIQIILPRSETPFWFVDELVIDSDTTIISIDDDETIHQIWSDRLKRAAIFSRHIMFSSGEHLGNWIERQKPKKAVYLLDYEFLRQKNDGLEIIDKLGIAQNSILVTSRYEESSLRRRAEALRVKIIPKALAPLVPIVFRENRKIDLVLIDDDTLMHMTWKLAAKKEGKFLKCFASFEEFSLAGLDININTPIFVDVSLKNGERGQDVAEKIFGLGYKNIRFTTGFDSSEIEIPNFVVEVISKTPKFGRSYDFQ